jgi:regulator of replication initiation timing
MLKTEQKKNQYLELEMYEEYDKKLAQMKEYIVDKVDQFLQYKGQEIYEQARRDVINDPRLAEHKVALDKIINITSGYLSDEGFDAVSSEKLQEATKAIEEMKGQLRVMEARNIRLSTENTKLNETVRQAQNVITESRKVSKKEQTINEQKERVSKATNVTGRGKTSEDAEVLSEYAAPQSNDTDQLLVLSGLKKAK